MKKVLFLHGFYASGSCPMAIALKEGLADIAEVLTPDLPLRPKQALELIREICVLEKVDVLFGNSNGAFLAQIVATELNIPALLGNPHLEMSKFVSSRLGENRYKSPRADGVQEFFIEETLIKEFEYLEQHQWDNWNLDKKGLCIGLFGEQDTLAHFEDQIKEHYSKINKFPGDHTPTVEDVMKCHIPVIKQVII